MAKVAGGALAAAVSEAGGLGIVGGGYGDRTWLAEQMALVGDARVGIGIIVWNMADDGLEALLGHQPAAVWLAFGNLSEPIRAVRDAGSLAICQVATADEAQLAVEAGASVLVAQGTESGGHGRPTTTVADAVASISDALPEVPLVAAGGINTQADLDALHAYGAAGAALGTAFYATEEAIEVEEAKRRLVEATGSDTIRSRVYDYVRGPLWPAGYDGRTVTTALTHEFAGHEDTALAADVDRQKARHAEAVSQRDMTTRVLWAGAGLDGVTGVVPASSVVERFERLR